MSFEKGIAYYTHGTVSLRVHFPEDRTICKYCRFLKHEYGYDRHRCVLTEEFIFNIRSRGAECPITLDKEGE